MQKHSFTSNVLFPHVGQLSQQAPWKKKNKKNGRKGLWLKFMLNKLYAHHTLMQETLLQHSTSAWQFTDKTEPTWMSAALEIHFRKKSTQPHFLFTTASIGYTFCFITYILPLSICLVRGLIRFHFQRQDSTRQSTQTAPQLSSLLWILWK